MTRNIMGQGFHGGSVPVNHLISPVHIIINTLNYEQNSYAMQQHHFTKEQVIFQNYSIVKDSSADLGVNFKIIQKRPTVQIFFAYLSIFLYFWEKIRRYIFYILNI